MTYTNQMTVDAGFEAGGRRPLIKPGAQKVAAWFRNGWQNWKERRRQMRAIRSLRQLDNHLLRDIGIDRSEITSAVIHGREGRRS